MKIKRGIIYLMGFNNDNDNPRNDDVVAGLDGLIGLSVENDRVNGSCQVHIGF
jgi:hypothetical protein